MCINGHQYNSFGNKLFHLFLQFDYLYPLIFTISVVSLSKGSIIKLCKPPPHHSGRDIQQVTRNYQPGIREGVYSRVLKTARQPSSLPHNITDNYQIYLRNSYHKLCKRLLAISVCPIDSKRSVPLGVHIKGLPLEVKWDSCKLILQ